MDFIALNPGMTCFPTPRFHPAASLSFAACPMINKVVWLLSSVHGPGMKVMRI
jgi:hypothetical protein